MKKRYWVIILVVVAIVVIGIVLFVSDSFPHSFFSGGKHRVVNQVNQYEILRDLLVIVLTLAGLGIALLSVAMFIWISSALDKSVEEKINEQINFASAKFYLELSYIYWGTYEVNGKFTKDRESDLGLAIDQSKNALEKTNLLDEKKFESYVALAKNNLAYHLAVRKYADDAERAISLAKYAYDRVWKYDYKDTYKYVETYAFVLTRLGDQEQKKEGVDIIRKTLERKDLPDSARKYIQQKYSGKDLSLGPTWD